jgi:nucleoside-diphosphate-sugar epimerase
VNNVMITGSTGAIGARVLSSVAAQPGVRRIYVLRDRAAASPEPALAQEPGAELRPLDGDPRQPRLGLDPAAFTDLCASVDTIFHCAERTVIDRDLDAARASNVQPVATLIEMLQHNPAARLAHVSTTMVAGTKRGLFTEFDLACGQGFHNAYEQSKFEAERLLRESAVADRVIVFRRSLTADELAGSSSGRPSSPLAAFLDTLRRGKLVLFAGDPRMHLDAVPLSYVAGSMVALAARPESLGKTLHLVAGWPRSRALGELVASIRERLGRSRVRFLPPALSFLARALGLAGLGLVAAFPGRRAALAPYFRHRCTFDDFQARALLAPIGLSCPDTDACLAEILDGTEAAAPPPARAVDVAERAETA